jgi:hypothetical protein
MITGLGAEGKVEPATVLTVATVATVPIRLVTILDPTLKPGPQ